jgi:hypothetical protein
MAIVEPISPTPDGRRRLRLRSTSNNEPFHELTVNTNGPESRSQSGPESCAARWIVWSNIEPK